MKSFGFSSKYFVVESNQLKDWQAGYAPLNVFGELSKMVEWLHANPRRRKKNYQRFVVNWLNKEHAKIQRAQIESRAYARVGSSGRNPSPEQHERTAALLKELEEWKAGR